MTLPNLTPSCEKLAARWPEKYRVDIRHTQPGIKSYILCGDSEFCIENLSSDSLDALLEPIGWQVYVKPYGEPPAKLEAGIYGKRKLVEVLKTNITVDVPQAQLRAKCLGFIRAVELAVEEKRKEMK